MSRSHTSLFSLRPGLTRACLTLALGTGGLLAGLPAHAQTLTVGAFDPNTGAPLGDGSATISNSGTSASGSYQFQATDGDPTLDPANSTYDAVNVYTPNSTLTVAGGSIGSLVNEGTSTISGGSVSSVTNYTGISTISGGSVSSVTNYTGTVNITGGTVYAGYNQNFVGLPTSILNISGGAIGSSDVLGSNPFRNDGITNVSGGSIAEFANYGSINLSGGNIFALENTGSANLSGGTVTSLINSPDFSVPSSYLAGSSLIGNITLSGGSVGQFSALDGSATTITGGTVGDFSTSGTSTADISGGTATSSVNAFDNAVVTISGGTFGDVAGPGAIVPPGTFIPVNFSSYDSGLIDILGNNLVENLMNPDGTYTITGTLLNDTSPFTAVFSDYTTDGNGLEFNGIPAIPGGPASFAPVPELSSATQMMLLLCLSALALVKLRKKKPASSNLEPGSLTSRS